jgi:hypothetical protein
MTMQQPDVEKMSTAPVEIQEQAVALESGRNFIKWSLVSLTLLTTFLGLSFGAAVWLLSMPPVPECQEISNLAPDRVRLSCAQQAAKSGDPEKVAQALALIATWTDDHPLRTEAQISITQWSSILLAKARTEFDSNNLDEALKWLRKIPKSSPKYEEAQQAIATWSGSWQQGKAVADKVQAAIAQKDWKTAEREAQILTESENEYLRVTRYQQLISHIVAERQGWKQLQDAEKAVKGDTVYDYERAVRLVNRIEANTIAKVEAQSKLDGWTQALFDRLVELKQRGDRAATLRIARVIPPEAKVYPETQKLARLAQAALLVTDESQVNQQLPDRIWTLVEAQAIARQLDRSSPLYQTSQEQIPEWQAYLKDLLQLQMASTIASVGQRQTLKLAIAQAQEIGSDRPSHDYTKRLVDQWRDEIEQLVDRPYLVRAQQLAQLGTIKGYKAAIAQASLVGMGRPLRNEAQTIVANGRKQIEVLEDQPLLTEAADLAKKKKYSAAIEVASKIKSNRALYQQAQSEIKVWLKSQDRDAIDKAIALAQKGKLTEAIVAASDISPDRPLYKEAQGWVADWLLIRDGSPSRGTVAASPEPAPTYYEPAPAPEPAYSEPAPTYYEPAPAPVPEPVYTAPAYTEPVPEPVYTAPAYTETVPEPVYTAPATEPEPEPVYTAPAYTEPAPEPVYTEPEPVYTEPAPESPLPKKPLLN